MALGSQFLIEVRRHFMHQNLLAVRRTGALAGVNDMSSTETSLILIDSKRFEDEAMKNRREDDERVVKRKRRVGRR
jgi:hypothetical protein